ncbi:MAG: hypothetical protein ACJ8EL_21740 [Rhizomicrobium sp.]|jgi:hypothetical protein
MPEGPNTVFPFTSGTPAHRVKTYRDRADQLRAIARDLVIDDLQDRLMILANCYDDMAAAAERSEITYQ